LASWIANVPHELAAAHLNIDVAVLKALTQAKTPVTPV
jgi:oxalate decarboxylase